MTTEATMWSTGGSNKLHCLGGECGLHDWTQLMADEVHTYVCTVAKTVHRRDVIGQPGSADSLNTAWKRCQLRGLENKPLWVWLAA